VLYGNNQHAITYSVFLGTGN